MRFTPTAFIGSEGITAASYWDADNPASWPGSGNTWYNLGVAALKGYPANELNLAVTSSLFKGTTTSGSYYEITGSQQLYFSGGGSQFAFDTNGRVQTVIYRVDLWDQVASGIRFYGRNDGSNLFWSMINSTGPSASYFAATNDGATGGYPSDLNATISGSILAGQFNYIVIQNNFTGGGYGSTVYLTSLDNFATPYPVNFSPGEGLAYGLDYISFMGWGTGKLKSIAAYNKILTQGELIRYTEIGPYI